MNFPAGKRRTKQNQETVGMELDGVGGLPTPSLMPDQSGPTEDPVQDGTLTVPEYPVAGCGWKGSDAESSSGRDVIVVCVEDSRCV